MNDIAYLNQPCDHNKVDDLLLDFVLQEDLTEREFFFVGSSFGATRYGDPDARYGQGVRFRRTLEFAPGATYTEEVDATVTAVTSFTYPTTINTVRLFKQNSTDTDRVEIPMITFSTTEVGGGSVAPAATFGSGNRLGQDHFGRRSTLISQSTVRRDDTINWELLDERTIRIYNYDPDNVYTADYNIPSVSCPKCSENDLIRDFTFDSRNRIRLVRNNDKILQEIQLALIRAIRSNRFFPNYGTDIPNLITQNPGTFNLVDKIKEQVIQQLRRIRDRQRRRIIVDPDLINPGEVIQKITQLDVERIEADTIKVTVGIQIITGDEITIVREYRI